MWFVFHDSSWGFHEPYFSRKHNFANRIEWTERKIMVLRPTNKVMTYPIIRHCHNFKNILSDNFQHHSFLFSDKSFVNIFFYRAENNIEKTRQWIIQTFIYYVTYFGAIIAFRKIVIYPGVWKFYIIIFDGK